MNVTRKERKAIREAADAMLGIFDESGSNDSDQIKSPTIAPTDPDDKKRKAYIANALKLQDILKRIKS